MTSGPIKRLSGDPSTGRELSSSAHPIQPSPTACSSVRSAPSARSPCFGSAIGWDSDIHGAVHDGKLAGLQQSSRRPQARVQRHLVRKPDQRVRRQSSAPCGAGSIPHRETAQPCSSRRCRRQAATPPARGRLSQVRRHVPCRARKPGSAGGQCDQGRIARPRARSSRRVIIGEDLRNLDHPRWASGADSSRATARRAGPAASSEISGKSDPRSSRAKKRRSPRHRWRPASPPGSSAGKSHRLPCHERRGEIRPAKRSAGRVPGAARSPAADIGRVKQVLSHPGHPVCQHWSRGGRIEQRECPRRSNHKLGRTKHAAAQVCFGKEQPRPEDCSDSAADVQILGPKLRGQRIDFRLESASSPKNTPASRHASRDAIEGCSSSRPASESASKWPHRPRIVFWPLSWRDAINRAS